VNKASWQIGASKNNTTAGESPFDAAQKMSLEPHRI
jgi:hypothetical protein